MTAKLGLIILQILGRQKSQIFSYSCFVSLITKQIQIQYSVSFGQLNLNSFGNGVSFQHFFLFHHKLLWRKPQQVVIFVFTLFSDPTMVFVLFGTVAQNLQASVLDLSN